MSTKSSNKHARPLWVLTLILFVFFLIIATMELLNRPGQGTYLTQPCIGSGSFSCYNLLLSKPGNVSVLFGQSTGRSLYNIELACVANTTSGGQPFNLSAWYDPVTRQLNNNQTISISMPCYGSNNRLLNASVGTTYQGAILINYTNSPSTPTPTNPWHTQLAVNIATKVV